MLTPNARLARTLLKFFDADALRRLLRSYELFAGIQDCLPGMSASPEALGEAIAVLLEQRGLIGEDLFSVLLAERPTRAAELATLAGALGVRWDRDSRTSEGSSLASLRRSIGLLRVDDLHGCTAWLIAPDRAMTARSGVVGFPEGLPVRFELPDAPAIDVRIVDPGDGGECMIVELARPIHDRRPLPIAGRCMGRAAGWSLGFGRPRSEWSVPLDGMLVFPAADADVTTVYSEALAVHMERPGHALSGAPILVDDCVVGMATQRLGRVDGAARALSGLVQAASAGQILARIGREADRPEVGGAADPIAPAIRDDEFHIVVSYASADAGWARGLEQRLALEGFRSFFAEPGHPDAPEDPVVGDALRRSRGAIVLMSRAWHESRACSRVASALQRRRQADPEFRLVIVELDDAAVPGIWAQCHRQEFHDSRGPHGPRWDTLVHALVWRDAPRTTSHGARGTAETSAIDSMQADLWAAAQAGVTEVIRIWRGWQEANTLPLAPSLLVAEYLISQSRADLALEILHTVGDQTRAEQLRGLALSRTGQHDGAIRILERLHRQGVLDSETMGLLAGRYKQLWCQNPRRLWIERAYSLYDEAWQRFGDAYTGINVAALALYRGLPEHSRRVARKVQAVLAAEPEQAVDHWKLATRAEAAHLLLDLEEARRWYHEAVKRCPEFYSDIAAMRAQARRNATYLGQPADILDDVLAVPRVVVVVGHMEDLPGRSSPRFPPQLVPAVRQALRARLRELDAGFGFSSLARGTDTLFIEEMIARRAQVDVLLPFSAADFEQSSVGPRWAPRFRELLADPRVRVQALTNTTPPADELPRAFDDCTHALFRRAIELAEALGDKPVLLAVWNGHPGDGVGGTADAVAYWQQTGHPLSLIDLGALYEPPSSQSAGSVRRHRAEMLTLYRAPREAS